MLLAFRRGAHCAPDWGVSAEGATYVPALHGEMRPARPPRAQEEGEPDGSPCLLRITTPSFRARCARKRKPLFCCAARPPQRVSRTGATPEQQARIARTRQRPVGWYPSFLLLMADGRQGGEEVTYLCARSAPLFAAANAENLSSFRSAVCSGRKRRRGDSQEGRNLGSSPPVCLRRIAANIHL